MIATLIGITLFAVVAYYIAVELIEGNTRTQQPKECPFQVATIHANNCKVCGGFALPYLIPVAYSGEFHAGVMCSNCDKGRSVDAQYTEVDKAIKLWNVYNPV